jgi:hypothetical protein
VWFFDLSAFVLAIVSRGSWGHIIIRPAQEELYYYSSSLLIGALVE